MQPSQLTALRFAADALTSRPESHAEVLNYVRSLWQDPVLQDAANAISTAIAASGSVGPQARLWEASERLLAEEGDPVQQNAGAALYSAILNKGWELPRLQIREALAGTRTNRLLAQYRRAAEELGTKNR